jgi:hypothetical protein
MGDVTLSYPTLSTTFTSTEVDDNLSDLQNAINGNLDDSNFKAGAGLDVDKLSAQYERMTVTFRVLNDASTINGLTAATPDLEDIATGTILDLVPIPGDSSDANWTIADVAWAMKDTGAGDNKVRIEWGYYDATGTWTVSTTPVAAWTLSNANAADDANDAHQVNGGTTAIDYNHATGGNTPRSLALVYDTAGAGSALSSGGDWLIVSVTLKRKIQAS